jgi:hypothetical protein
MASEFGDAVQIEGSPKLSPNSEPVTVQLTLPQHMVESIEALAAAADVLPEVVVRVLLALHLGLGGGDE